MSERTPRWQRINEILEQVLEQPADQREALVRSACGSDSGLADEVLDLLQHDLEETAIQSRALSAIDDALRDIDQRRPLIGSRIGPFVLTREIARGGMGQVFEARRDADDFDQTVAVKILPGHRLDQEAGRRFAAERRILAGLNHPNIAKLIDGGTLDDGMPYIVMEYVDGLRIDRYCQEQHLSNSAIIELVLKVCDAVQFAHRNLVVHRDIKPANILVDRDGQPKLLDFGIAKLIDIEEDGSGEHTRTGLRLLTPAYASPEQIRGGDVTTAVDVYALGLLTYLLLTHRLPYSADPTDAQTLENQILSEPPEAPSDALIRRVSLDPEGEPLDWPLKQRRAVRGELDTILLTALRKEPERRYANVAAFADDLRRHLEHRPIQARSDTLAYRFGLLFKRHPVGVPLSALAVALAIGASTAFTWMLAEERDQALAAEARAVQTAQFAESLLSRTNPEQDGASLMTAVDFLDGARSRVDEELRDTPRIAFSMHRALANAYLSWNQYDSAQQQVDRMLTLAEQLGDPLSRARALRIAAVVSDFQDRLEDSLAYAYESAVLFRELGQLQAHADLLALIGEALLSHNRMEEALPALREALEVSQRVLGEESAQVADVMSNLGWALHASGRKDEALRYYTEALRIQERVRAPTEEINSTRNNLAALYGERGELLDAAEMHQKSLDHIIEARNGVLDPDMARAHAQLAHIRMQLGQFDRAAQHSADAVAINVELLGPEHRFTAITYAVDAWVLVEADRLLEAENRIAQAEPIMIAAGAVLENVRVHIPRLRGLIALKRRDWAGAEEQFLIARSLIDSLTNIGRAPLNEVDLGLALARAQQGQSTALEMANGVLERMRSELGEDNWRVRLLAAELTLPPFQNRPRAEEIQTAERVRSEVAAMVGPTAIGVVQLGSRIEAGRQALAAGP
jgi:serine/threonine-protein kinase